MNREHIHHYSKDNRRAEVYFDKTMEIFVVEMITDGVIHSERYAEDAAENWVEKLYCSRGEYKW